MQISSRAFDFCYFDIVIDNGSTLARTESVFVATQHDTTYGQVNNNGEKPTLNVFNRIGIRSFSALQNA